MGIKALLVVVLALFGALGMPARAQVSTPVLTLSEALQMRQVIETLRLEGLRNGDELAVDLPGGANDPAWQAKVSQLYDAERMLTGFTLAFETGLAGDVTVIDAGTAFFASDLGQRIMTLENDARRTLLDPDIEEAAKAAFAGMPKDNPARVAQLERFAKANDLIESNVMGSLNSNIAFFRGMAAAGGEYAMPEADMLAEVWAGEAQARADTVEWLFPYLALAYQPLSDAELQSYIDFSETPAGRKVNGAMFKAFDAIFDEISTALGLAVAQAMASQDI